MHGYHGDQGLVSSVGKKVGAKVLVGAKVVVGRKVVGAKVSVGDSV